MKVLIVGKARQGAGACVAGLTFDGRSVRLVSPDPADERAGLGYGVGEVWEIEGEPPASLQPPHMEDLGVRSRRKLGPMQRPELFIERQSPPREGGVEELYEGMTRVLPSGAVCVTEQTGVPPYSASFWRPDRPLRREPIGRGICYVYPAAEGPRKLPFVGFQEPPEEIPAGTLLHLTLGPWRQPQGRPEEEPRCYVQLSGWFPLELRPPATPSLVVDDSYAASPEPYPEPEGFYSGEGLSHPLASPAPPARPPAREAAPPAFPAPNLDAARELLKRVWGYDAFRPLQETIIAGVLGRRDTLGVMPTGAGKSLCYQLPALLSPGLTVVVSPLISLMQDQVDQLRAVGAPAVYLNSTLSHSEYASVTRQVRAGEARLLYLAPETLLRPETLLLLDESRVERLVVDEAHCISEWGHDFRPEYRNFRPIRARYRSAACLALTATATPRVQADIRGQLGIAERHTFIAPFDRPNLLLEVRRRGAGWEQVAEFVAAREQESGIVYAGTRDQVDLLVAELGRRGVRALPYHAGLPDHVRRDHQRAFTRDEVAVIVATVAFGMGINKPNVRYVLHAALPDCLETYYQQVGRAGRDGLPSECLLLFARADIGTIYHFIRNGAAEEQPGRSARLQAMVRFAEATRCRRAVLLPYFGDAAPEEPCGSCDNCLATAAGRARVEVSADARLLLSAVRQTGQRFGLGHVVEVLRGARTQRLLRLKHDALEVYGGGKHRSVEEWKRLTDQFLEQELLEQEMEYGTFRVTEAGRQVLEGAQVFVVEEATPAAERRAGPLPHDALLFQALRTLRKRLADEAGVPPYVIFSDRSLVEMAARYPASPQEFLQVHGVGERKAAAYAEPFLAVIREHVESHGKEEFDAGPAPEAAPPREAGRRCVEVGSLHGEGLSLKEIQERFGVQEATVIQNLYEYFRSGGPLDAERLLAESHLSERDRKQVLGLLESQGHERLGPVFAALKGSVSYRELHLLRLYRLALEKHAMEAAA